MEIGFSEVAGNKPTSTSLMQAACFVGDETCDWCLADGPMTRSQPVLPTGHGVLLYKFAL